MCSHCGLESQVLHFWKGNVGCKYFSVFLSLHSITISFWKMWNLFTWIAFQNVGERIQIHDMNRDHEEKSFFLISHLVYRNGQNLWGLLTQTSSQVTTLIILTCLIFSIGQITWNPRPSPSLVESKASGNDDSHFDIHGIVIVAVWYFLHCFCLLFVWFCFLIDLINKCRFLHWLLNLLYSFGNYRLDIHWVGHACAFHSDTLKWQKNIYANWSHKVFIFIAITIYFKWW